MSHEEIFLEKESILEEASNTECKNLFSGRPSSCSCLKILRDPKLRSPVALFMVNVAKSTKQQIDQKICNWYWYAKSSSDVGHRGGSPRVTYKMPFDGTEAFSSGGNLSPLMDASISSYTMSVIMGVKKDRYSAIVKVS